MIYLARSFLCDKGTRKLYQTVTHVIYTRQESQLIALPHDDKLVWDWYSLRGSSKREEPGRMSQDVGMQADSNAPPLSAKSHRLCASGYVTAGRKLSRGLVPRFKGPSPRFPVDYFSSSTNSSTRVN